MLRYTLEALDSTPSGQIGYSWADGVNQAGLACGTSSELGTVIWADGSSAPQALAGDQRRAARVNASAHVVGETWGDNADVATVTADNDLSAVLGPPSSWAADINDAGVIVGGAKGYSDTRPFIYDSAAATPAQFLAPLHGDKRAAASAITETGDVLCVSGVTDVMGRGFVHRAGQDDPFGTVCSATALSASGFVTGQRNFKGDATSGGGYPVGHAYRIDVSAGPSPFDDLGKTQAPNYIASEGMDVNAAGVVVGYSMPDYANMGDKVTLGPRAFVHFPHGTDAAGFHDLQDVVPDAPGWEFWEALGVNDAGQIVGMGHYGNNWRGFRLTRDYTSHLGHHLADYVAGYIMLFGGVSRGGGGFGITPGGKRVPIPPRDWFTTAWLHLSAGEREATLKEAEGKLDAAGRHDAHRSELQAALRDLVARVERRGYR